MTDKIGYCFETDWIDVPLGQLTPSKIVGKGTKNSKRYKQIESSIKECGLVEPLVVFKIKGSNEFMLLDGHIRLDVLKTLGASTAQCLLAKDDETYTYNKRINQLSSIQEHHMIVRAIESGISEEKVSRALGVNIENVKQKVSLLKRICPEAIEILKDARFTSETASVLRRMKPIRQIEVAELMVASNNFASSYARALLVATSADQLVESKGKRPLHGLSSEQRDKMEREMEALQRDIKAVEEHYGNNMLQLVVANAYLSKLTGNSAVSEYLRENHAEVMEQLLSVQDSIDADMGVHAEDET